MRAIVEAVYEPPQKGGFEDVKELPDKDAGIVNSVAKALGFIKVGWIFTSKDADMFLTSNDVLKIARLQESNSVAHPSGARVSKFVTVKAKVLSMKGETGVDACMVSDQCQALVRDSVFAAPKDNEHLLVRKANSGDVVPSVIYGKSGDVDAAPVEYFVVNVASGTSKDNEGYNTLKCFDFPRENRPDKPQSKGDVKSYFQKHSLKSAKSYLDFHLLIYLAKLIDVKTIENLVESVLKKQTVTEGIAAIVEGIAK